MRAAFSHNRYYLKCGGVKEKALKLLLFPKNVLTLLYHCEPACNPTITNHPPTTINFGYTTLSTYLI